MRRPARTRSVTSSVTTALVALLLAAPVGVLAGTAPAGAAPRDVRDGHARFEMLSPTLIRLEYAGDDAFTDQATFNAVGRDSRPVPNYTTDVENGWRVIRTDKLTLSYKQGSGPFGPDNLTLELHTGTATVTAHPAFAGAAPDCGFGTGCEAEDGALSGGASSATDHTGYTGAGFVAGLGSAGATVGYRITGVPAAGDYPVTIRYANSTGGDGKNETRTLTASGSGASARFSLPVTGNWDQWKTASATLHLPAGDSVLSVGVGGSDSGNVNIDSLAVTAAGAPYPAVRPAPCPYDTLCEAERGTLAGGATAATNHVGFSGTGFSAGLEQSGASSTVRVSGVPADGDYDIGLRYANSTGGDGRTEPRTVSVTANGTAGSLTLPVTASWNNWSTASTKVHLAKGTDTVAVGCGGSDSCHVNVDNLAVTPAGDPYPQQLGGYRRSLDGQAGPAPMSGGMLNGGGWYLMDDSKTALLNTSAHTVSPRPGHGSASYQDGYLFGYGADYPRALADLTGLTGPSTLLPRFAYGVWYSRYYPYTTADYEQTVLPRFRSEQVPLDTLVVDTDYKSPDTWNGWNWNPNLFPDPAGFEKWAAGQGLHVTKNIHPSIQESDPKYAQAQQTAQGKLQVSSSCYSDTGHNGPCHIFDWSDPNQLKAYMDLHTSLETKGVDDFWWLDYCCEGTTASMPGITPDGWINQNYAWRREALGERGFVLSRVGSSLSAGYSGSQAYPSGPWTEHRSSAHFTGDTTSTFDALANEVAFTPAEGAGIGLPAVSHDIGGFNGNHPSDDLYVRWVQLGAFQPLLRLHSNHGDRLPWDYDDAAKGPAEKFLRLREALLPYTYSVARQSTVTGMPMLHAPYLDYPDQAAAYQYASTEYLYGPNMLVAPDTTAGTSSGTTVWFPPGTWTDYFTGQRYTGPSTATVTTDLNRMPVFVKSGGIVPQRTDAVTGDVGHPLQQVTLTVGTGASGGYDLYEDAGDGNGYRTGQSATSGIAYQESGGAATLTIGAPKGSYPGQVSTRTWTANLLHAARPTTVTADGRTLTETATGPGWSYDTTTGTLTVRLPAGAASTAHTIKTG